MNFHNVASFYDVVAERYDSLVTDKADYQIPGFLKREFDELGFNKGSILDIGCGTGKLTEYLDGYFSITGIDVSPKMASIAMSRGYEQVIIGPAETELATFESKSFDHVVALSSLYFIERLDPVIFEMIRIARKSIFVSLEQIDQESSADLLRSNISVFNHRVDIFNNARISENTYLWKRPLHGTKIFGYIVHKII